MKELEQELKTSLNFFKRTIACTTKLVPQVIVISYLEEEMEIGLQPCHNPNLGLTAKARAWKGVG
jgi:hypothetical protein